MEFLRKLSHGYQIVFEEWPDPRTKSWPLAAKPYQVLTLLTLYLMFVFKWGPQWMKHRPPFNLDKLLIPYNLFQIVSCIYIFVNSITIAWGWDYQWFCEPVDFSVNEKSMRIAKLVYCYYLLKILDLLDTVFFVLRKKHNQSSFLHIYHHTGMVCLIWGAITYLPGGHGTMIGVINSFVHIVMYFYYLLTVAKPSLKNSIWWKKHITQLQIVQFLLCVIHMGGIVFIPDCAFPRWTAALFLPQNLFMLVLFLDFYIKTYIKKKPAKQNGDVKVNNYSNKEHNS